MPSPRLKKLRRLFPLSLRDCGITLQDFMFLRERYSDRGAFQYYVYDHLSLYEDGVFQDQALSIIIFA